MLHTYRNFFLQHWRIFILSTLFFTSILLFLNIQVFWLLLPIQRTVSYVASDCKSVNLLNEFNEKGHLMLTGANLPFLIEELMRINHSVRNELIELDQRRRALLTNVAMVQTQLEYIRSKLVNYSRQFMRLRTTIASYQQHLSDLVDNTYLFRSHWPQVQYKQAPPSMISVEGEQCTMDTCLNWKNCPLGGHLKFCLIEDSSTPLEETLLIRKSPHFVSSCTHACLLVLLRPQHSAACPDREQSDGSPTCLALVSDTATVADFEQAIQNQHKTISLIFASSHYAHGKYRSGFDFISPANYDIFEPASLHVNSSLLPGRRSVLLAVSLGRPLIDSRDRIDETVVSSLQKLSSASDSSDLHIILRQGQAELLACWPSQLRQAYSNRMMDDSDWFPCHDAPSVLSNTTFSLILDTVVTHSQRSKPISLGWQLQLVLSLMTGAIPVVLDHNPPFPLHESISPDQWSRAVVRLPRPRLPELVMILQSIPEHHLVEMRRQGRLLFDRYFRDASTRLASLFLAVSRRLGYPQPPSPSWTGLPAFESGSFEPTKRYSVPVDATFSTDLDDFLGPIGPTQNSVQFPSNFTGSDGAAVFATVHSPSVGGGASLASPFWSHPSVPGDVFLPSDAPFSSAAHTRQGLRPINHSVNLAGFEFNIHLGGMYPYEQFTIVLLMYDRFELACQTLERLNNLPYLHSIVVVWNFPRPPPLTANWPLLHVPIRVVRSANKSLNNRFLPYDIIQTDCILSIDDDVQLRHDEIVFGFRVWREHRDQLVGFPVRSHYWNTTAREWYYHSDYSCEFSLVLTGAAFLHKYYLFAYTWEMPVAIRGMVDEQMNCEDLVMNFLIAHLTRKPPLKVTIHWSFACPTCTSALHGQPEHYAKRSKCLNWLANFYGYTPLVYTQYRADSVLFKTRLPPSKQKCFKFI